MASLSLKNIYKVYPNGFNAVKDFNLEIEDKEFIIFVGPSGCGKSTTLRMIAGLEDISSGELWIGDKLVNDVEPKDRDIAMVFQNYALYPHMSVYDNMAFGLKLRKVPKEKIDNVALPLLYAGVPKKERRERAIEALKLMGLGERLEFRPNQLSGGQCQRVAIARAIVGKPKLLLADEPTGALDSAAGEQIMDIFDSLNQNGATIIMITHERFIAERAKEIRFIRDGILSEAEKGGGAQ